MDAREKEQYLREYSILKNQGKPFFPYAIAKDGAMACVTLGMIIAMSILFGAELRAEGGPDDHDLRHAPRVVLLLPVRAAAGGEAAGARVPRDRRHPHDLPGPASGASVHRPQPGAQPAAAPDRHDGRDRHDRGAWHLTILGPPPARPRRSTSRPRRAETRPGGDGLVGLLGCHKVGENGNTLGPNLSDVGDRLGMAAIARTLVNPAPMPAYGTLQQENPQQFQQLVEYVASLRSD